MTTNPTAAATIHPVAPADLAAVQAMRLAIAPMKGHMNGPDARPAFAAIMAQTPAAASTYFEADTVGGVPGWWCHPATAGAPATAGLFLHGGCFVMGSATTHRHLVSQLVARVGFAFFIPDYRLAPEHPFPAAVEDVLAAYQGLVARGLRQLVVCGDSAGGALTLLTLAALGPDGGAQPPVQRPLAALVFSPMTDLALSGPSMQTRAEADPIFTQEPLASFVQHYLQGHDPRDAQASPLYGTLQGLAPVQIHVGDAEVLLDDSVRYAARAQAAGGVADLHIWEGLPHGFAANVTGLLGASQALDLGAAFLKEQLP